MSMWKNRHRTHLIKFDSISNILYDSRAIGQTTELS